MEEGNKGLSDNEQFLLDKYPLFVRDIRGAREYQHPLLVQNFAFARGCSEKHAELVFLVLKIHLIVHVALDVNINFDLEGDEDLKIMLRLFVMDARNFEWYCKRYLGKVVRVAVPVPAESRSIH